MRHDFKNVSRHPAAIVWNVPRWIGLGTLWTLKAYISLFLFSINNINNRNVARDFAYAIQR